MSQLTTVKGVEIFASGQHRERSYSVADLDHIAANVGRLKALLRPTVAVGHEEDQRWLQDSGYPAAGVVQTVRRVGSTLVADFAEVPEAIAKLIKSRAYRSCSAEIYDDFQHGGKRYGLTLRRVALLGAQLPQVKTLADLPVAGYSESTPPRRAVLVLRDVRRAGAGLLRCFSEVRPMAANAAPNADLVQMLTEVGMEPELAASVAGKLTPDEVAEVVRLAGGATPEPEEPMTAAEMAKANKTYRAHSEQRPAPMTAARREQLLKSSSLGAAVLRNEQKNRRR